MRSSPLLLLCLLWSLVEVHSQTEYPYVSFIGGSEIALPNHAYVNLSLVGEYGNVSVRCHTDLGTCCSEAEGDHRGDWIPPGSEESLPLSSDTSADIYQVQGDRRVILRRRNNADMSSGIYRCDIPTNATDDSGNSVRKSVYVGLYAGGGNCQSKYVLGYAILLYNVALWMCYIGVGYTTLSAMSLTQSSLTSLSRRCYNVWWCNVH